MITTFGRSTLSSRAPLVYPVVERVQARPTGTPDDTVIIMSSTVRYARHILNEARTRGANSASDPRPGRIDPAANHPRGCPSGGRLADDGIPRVDRTRLRRQAHGQPGPRGL